MKMFLIMLSLLALIVAGCMPTNPNDYRVVNNGEVTIISGEKYGYCAAGMKFEKIEVSCIGKDGLKSLVVLADSFEMIKGK